VGDTTLVLEVTMLIDRAAELLKDGKWHRIEKIADLLNQSEQEILRLLNFCAEFKILAFDQTGKKVKIDEGFANLLE
jgi:hypothetical protein